MPSSAFVDQYKVLGISRNASREGIVAAHRQIALGNAAGQLGLGDEAELRLKQANAARTILLRDRARYDRQLAQHEAHLAAIRTGGSERTGLQAGTVIYPRRATPQPIRRPA
jgi:DnaJ-class molecular chaperone